jgi:hypothetical protein
MSQLKHTTGVRTDGGNGGTYGVGATAKGRQPAADTITYNASNVRQYPELFSGQSTD